MPKGVYERSPETLEKIRINVKRLHNDWCCWPVILEEGVEFFFRRNSTLNRNYELISFLIDEADVTLVSQYSWSIKEGYPYCSKGTLHQLLGGKAPVGYEWDHINRNTLDNRRCNLRRVTNVVNNRNAGPRYNNPSGIRGVQRHRRVSGLDCWLVTITHDGYQHYLGLFNTIEEAAQARKEAELLYWRNDV